MEAKLSLGLTSMEITVDNDTCVKISKELFDDYYILEYANGGTAEVTREFVNELLDSLELQTVPVDWLSIFVKIVDSKVPLEHLEDLKNPNKLK